MALEASGEVGSLRSFPGVGLLQAIWKEEILTENLLITLRVFVKSPSTLGFFDFQFQLEISSFSAHELFLKVDLTEILKLNS